ncbi:MAG: metallophosphoesterase [Clostridia bacterium]|nr:metallophosphoesterase [Clostridia bacterium]
MSLFLIAVTSILLLNLSWYLVSDYWLRSDLAQYPRARNVTRLALVIWMTIIVIPIIGMTIPYFDNPLGRGPWGWLALFYLWMGSIFFWMIGMGILGVPISVYNYFTKKSRSRKHGLQTKEEQNNTLTRRKLLRLALVAAPPLIVSGSTMAAVATRDRLNIYTKDLPVVDLPDDLNNLTITHLSDLHIGMVTGRDRIERIITEANSLKSNIIVVTGDILDQDLQYMPDLLETIGELKAPMGVYLCLGNHDKIQDPYRWIKKVRGAELDLLLNESVIVDTGRTPLKIMGIDFTHRDNNNFTFIQKAEKDNNADNALKILLAHHPHAFDAAAVMGIPITLAGHTHGGQLVLKDLKGNELFNPGNRLFRYVKGIYHSPQGHTLYVHAGSGDWFPLRMGVPCEIIQLRLVPAQSKT